MTLPGEDDPSMQQRELLEHFDTRINDLRGEIRGDIGDVKEMLSSHLDMCQNNMKDHNDRIRVLEAGENKRVGAIAILVFLVTLFGGYFVVKVFHVGV